MKLTAENVTNTFKEYLFTEKEIKNPAITNSHIKVEGYID